MVDTSEPTFSPLPRTPTWSVSALVLAVADALAARFSVTRVRGEIFGFSRAASGHCYFSLKDSDGHAASIRCVMFRRAASLLDFNPTEGQLVEVRGCVSIYEPRGELQFIIEAIAQAGAGALYEQFLRLKRKLEAEGLFDSARKRALPIFPRTVGVITSLGAAALHDVASAFSRRAPHVSLIVYPSLVQGADAPPALVETITLARQRGEVDVLIICRGGGSLEDLWAFNDERVVRAIAAATLPVLCGIGHESDVTLAELAADVRAATPTAAAEIATPRQSDCARHLSDQVRRLTRAIGHRINTAHQNLDRLGAKMIRPSERMGHERTRLALLLTRLPQAFTSAVQSRHESLSQHQARFHYAVSKSHMRLRHTEQQLATRLHALNPQQVVARGYVLIQAASGQLIVAPEQIGAGDQLRLTLARGQAEITVASKRCY